MVELIEFFRIMRNGDENVDDIVGCFIGMYIGVDVRFCKYGIICEIIDKKGKGFFESGKGEVLEIFYSFEKELVSCLIDWYYRIKMFILF